MAVFPTTTPNEIIENADDLLFADTSDSSNLKKTNPQDIVSAGVGGISSDDVSQWSSNLYMTPWERAKVASIETWAEVNQVNTVNWLQGPVVLTQDNVWDGSTFVRTNNNFTDTNVSNLNNNTIHRWQTNNPHNVTKSQIWLSNVTNDVQLSQTAGNFDTLTEKTDIQLHLNDKYVLQDSDDVNNIKSVTNQTDLIWKSAYIQIRWPSINYYDFTFTSSTTYNIQSLVTFDNRIYYCTVSHQSSGSFSADLANGYWQEIGGTAWTWNILSNGNWAPVNPWVNVWDIYVDSTNWDLYYRDGTSRQVFSFPQNFTTTSGAPIAWGTVVWETLVDPTTWIIYIWNGATWTTNQANWAGWWVNYDVWTTLGNKVTFSVWTGANTIAESSMWYDPATDTFSFDWSNITYNDATETRTWNNTTNLPDWASHTYNLDGDVNNNYGATYTENNDYTTGATINNDGTVDITNAETYIENISWGTTNYSNVTENYNDTPVQISCEVTPTFGTTYTAPADTQYVEVQIEYDNGVDPVVSKTLKSPLSSSTQTISFETATDTGVIELVWSGTDFAVNVLSGSTFSFASTDPLCRYNGVSEVNMTNTIIQNDNVIEENTNTTQVFDSNSTIINNWDTVLENLEVTNIEVTGQVVGANKAHVEEFTATAWQTTFTLANTPASAWFVRVSSRSSLYAKQGATRDFIVVGDDVVLNAPATAWDVITVQYVESLWTPLSIPSITTGVTASMTGSSLVVADANATATSVITWTAQTNTVWFIEIVPWAWSFTINSSASETGVVFNYVITN